MSQQHLPEDDDSLHVVGEGAALRPLPLGDQLLQVSVLQEVGEDLDNQVLYPLARHGQQHQEQDVGGAVADELDERLLDELARVRVRRQHVAHAVVGVHHAHAQDEEGLLDYVAPATKKKI